MTVADLIQELQRMPGYAPVYVVGKDVDDEGPFAVEIPLEAVSVANIRGTAVVLSPEE